ncbi:ATP-grasp domain-containing protein [Pantoea agglomerans]|uniref:ATP-grasp domain-containing protein n=1 Tax=Enterobacter agglomerans TaxID=549 RepID=UPI001F366EAA|nr:ATP-grasp domain-containing protein [Pantoea agglomerans]UJQ24795.1 ATP-grasp domain-containing protein [Pantoea agglomerans]
MLLICKYWYEAYKALDNTGHDYVAIIDASDAGQINHEHELSGGMKYKFFVESVDSIEAITSIVNMLSLMNINIDRVLSIGELSQYCAGFLSDLLKCKGLSFDTINNTRDKCLMKKRFKELNLPCADFELIHEKFERTLSYPLIAKPTCGFGTLNTNKINNDNDFNEYISEFKKVKDHHLISNGIMLEEYISGEEYAADCLIANSEIKLLSISKYIIPRVELKDNKSKYDSVEHLKREDNIEIYLKIEEMYYKIFKGFNIDNCVCHLEFFLGNDNEITLSEIGSRPGGAYLNLMAKNVYGWTLYEAWFESVLNHKHEVINELSPTEHCIIISLIPQKNGKLMSPPSPDLLNKYHTLSSFDLRKKIGDSTTAFSIIDFTCFFVFKGENLDIIRKEIASFTNSFEFDIC